MNDLEWNKYVQNVAKTVPNPIKECLVRNRKTLKKSNVTSDKLLEVQRRMYGKPK